MARRKKQEEDAGAMDSLLDTMTNVVGILVIVLVVTQLGVGDAVQRISQSLDFDPAEIEKKKEELSQLAEQQQIVKDEMKVLKPQDDTQIALQIIQAERKINEEQILLKNIRQENKQALDKMSLGKKEADEEKKKREKLEADIKTSLADQARLKAILDQTPDREVLPAEELRLPNPRPAPEGVQAIALICDNNKIYPLRFGEIQKAARAKAQEIIRTKKLNKDATAGIDPEKFVKEFNRKPMRTDYYEVTVRALDSGIPQLTLTPLDRVGLREKDVLNRSSKFQKDLRSLDPNKFFIRFFVSSDSYDLYLTARQVAEQNKFSVGWIPQPQEWKFSGWMGGDIRLGPPKSQKPANNNQPQTPPKKQNDID